MRRNLSAVRGLVILALLAVLVALAAVPQRALADGDPGSDVLLAQNLFYGPTDGVTVQQELQLNRLLDATASAGAPVRVAIIGRPADLGAVGGAWGQPQTYARFLATELKNVYSGRLLIVMPSGYGVYWYAHTGEAPTLAGALKGLKVGGDTGADLVAATRGAVLAIEQKAGISAAKLAATGAGSGAVAGTTATTGSSSAGAPPPATTGPARSHHHLPSGLFAVVLVLIAIAYIALRRGWRPSRPPEGWWSRISAGLRRVRIRPIALVPTLLLLVVVLVALAVNQSSHPGASQASDLQHNPGLDQGTPLTPKSAPNFTLYDESGSPVSLKQYRGKVVILSFVDAECETLCPLTTQAMLDAKADLGAAGADVQLLGVNANWRSTQIDDVANYTQMHGLSGRWHFLTNPNVSVLERVWSAFGVNEKKLIRDEASQIDHIAATFVIDPRGRIREAYTTYPNYTAIPQQGQLLAQEASRLLPSHPAVDSHLSYAAVQGITPAQTTTLPRPGGGSLTLGPGKPHLYLFFDTWNRQTTTIGADLRELNRYQADAKRLGLPPVTAIDEGSVEPNAGALPAFLKSLSDPLDYPVAIDSSGRVADGYGVQGEPWLVLTNAAGRKVWYQEVYTEGWPSLATLEQQVKTSLSSRANTPTSAALKGSPKPLAQLHAQASQLLGGGTTALYRRIAQLSGYPIVLNIWGSWCVPCQREFGYFKAASAEFGKHVAFLGADYNDVHYDPQLFLREHHVYYPSYSIGTSAPYKLLPGGVQGTPTTIFITPDGQVSYRRIAAYPSLGALEADIEQYATSNP